MAKKNLRIHSSRLRRRTLQFFEFYNKMTTPEHNEEDVVKLNIPLLIRLFEFARETFKDTLHKILTDTKTHFKE